MEKKQKSDSEVLVPEVRKVKISGEEFVVNPYSVKDVIHFTRDLIEGLNVIKKQYLSLEFKPEDVLQYLPVVLDEAPRLFGLLATAIGKDQAWLEEQKDLAGVSQLFLAITEINDFGTIISNFRAGWSKLKSQTVTA